MAEADTEDRTGECIKDGKRGTSNRLVKENSRRDRVQRGKKQYCGIGMGRQVRNIF